MKNLNASKQIKSVERPGNGSSSKKSMGKTQISKSKASSTLRPVGVKMKKQTSTLKHVKNSTIQPEGLIDDAFKIGKVGLDVVTTATKILNEPLDLETYTKAIPDTIMKVVNTVNEIVDGQPKSKVILSGPVKGQQNQFLDLIAKEAPVFNTTSAPAGFGSEFSKPDTKIYNTGSTVNGMQISRIINTVNLSAVSFPATNVPGVATSQYRTALFAWGNFGSRVDNFVKLFDRFKIVKLTYTYVPSTGTDTKGSVHMAFRRAPKDFTAAGLSTITDLSQLERYSENVPWKGCSMDIPVENEFLYTGDVASTDVKWYANGFFCLSTSGNTNVIHPERLGNMYVTSVIDCYGAIPPNYFPALLSGPCLTRMLGMSLYQTIGSFTNNDLRNLFRWTQYTVKQAIENVKGEFYLKNVLMDDSINNEDMYLNTVTDRKLTSKGHKFRTNCLEFDDFSLIQIEMANNALLAVLNEVITIIDEIFVDKKRAGNVIKAFAYELLNWNVLSSTYRPWMETLMNYLPKDMRDSHIIKSDICSIWNFVTIILDDLSTLFSIDKDLVFDEDLEIDKYLSNTGLLETMSIEGVFDE